MLQGINLYLLVINNRSISQCIWATAFVKLNNFSTRLHHQRQQNSLLTLISDQSCFALLTRRLFAQSKAQLLPHEFCSLDGVKNLSGLSCHVISEFVFAQIECRITEMNESMFKNLSFHKWQLWESICPLICLFLERFLFAFILNVRFYHSVPGLLFASFGERFFIILTVSLRLGNYIFVPNI